MNIDIMLYKDMIWLTKQTNRPITEFAKIVSQISLAEDDIAKFWEIVSKQRNALHHL